MAVYLLLVASYVCIYIFHYFDYVTRQLHSYTCMHFWFKSDSLCFGPMINEKVNEIYTTACTTVDNDTKVIVVD